MSFLIIGEIPNVITVCFPVFALKSKTRSVTMKLQLTVLVRVIIFATHMTEVLLLFYILAMANPDVYSRQTA